MRCDAFSRKRIDRTLTESPPRSLFTGTHPPGVLETGNMFRHFDINLSADGDHPKTEASAIPLRPHLRASPLPLRQPHWVVATSGYIANKGAQMARRVPQATVEFNASTLQCWRCTCSNKAVVARHPCSDNPARKRLCAFLACGHKFSLLSMQSMVRPRSAAIMRRLGDDEPREPHGRAFVNMQLLIEAGSL
jgi:hypothetical protein